MNPLRQLIARTLAAAYRKTVGTGETYTLMDAKLGKFLSGNTTNAGKTVNQDNMLSMSAAFGCIRILTETLGTLPWHVYEDDGRGNAVKVPDHPVAAMLAVSPNANMTAVEFKEASAMNLCQGGNAYSYMERRGNGSPISAVPLQYDHVEPKQRNDGTVFYKVLDRGKWVELPQEKIWHVKGFGRTGLMGLSPLGAAREALGTALAMEEFGARFFSQGGMMGGYVTMPGFAKDKEQRDILRENLNQLVGGIGNAHKFALMEGGMKPEPFASMPLEDMQFILSRKFSIQEICRFYRVPPHMVADLDRATFSNIEHMSQEFVMFTLMPYFTRFEASATKWLFTPKERAKYFLRFNYEGLLRADTAARAAFYSSALQNGYMNRNEVRGKENLPRSEAEGMNDYTVQSNMTVVHMLEATAQANIDKANAPPPSPPMPEEPVVEPKASANNFTLLMPETVKHQLTQLVQVPGVAKLAKAVEDSASRNSLSVAAAIANCMKVSEHLDERTDELKRLAMADRMAVFNDQGEPIGTRVVLPEDLRRAAD